MEARIYPSSASYLPVRVGLLNRMVIACLRTAGVRCDNPRKHACRLAPIVRDVLQVKLRAAQVTRRNFEDVLPQVRDALAECSFYAFDCEMTGLSETDHGSQYLDDIEERYRQACAPALGTCVAKPGRVRTANEPQACCTSQGAAGRSAACSSLLALDESSGVCASGLRFVAARPGLPRYPVLHTVVPGCVCGWLSLRLSRASSSQTCNLISLG